MYILIKKERPEKIIGWERHENLNRFLKEGWELVETFRSPSEVSHAKKSFIEEHPEYSDVTPFLTCV